jgi:hypothetical protein
VILGLFEHRARVRPTSKDEQHSRLKINTPTSSSACRHPEIAPFGSQKQTDRTNSGTQGLSEKW